MDRVRIGLSAGESRIRTIGFSKGPSAPSQIFQVPFIPAERCPGPQEKRWSDSGFEEGEFEADGATKEVATQICLSRPDAVLAC
jgi:hypothetical protein